MEELFGKAIKPWKYWTIMVAWLMVGFVMVFVGVVGFIQAIICNL